MTDEPPFRVEWAFICDYALIDSIGKISIIGVFDRLFAPAFPTVHPVLYLPASWVGPPGQTAAVELRIWNPSKELAATVPQQLGFGPEGRSTGIFQISPLLLNGPGQYLFELLAGGISVRHLELNVVPITTDEQGSTTHSDQGA